MSQLSTERLDYERYFTLDVSGSFRTKLFGLETDIVLDIDWMITTPLLLLDLALLAGIPAVDIALLLLAE